MLKLVWKANRGEKMKKTNIRLIATTLSAIVLLSTTSCKLQRDNDFDNSNIVINNKEKLSHIKNEQLKFYINELAEKVSNSNFNLSIEDFYDKVEKTTFVEIDGDQFQLGFYNESENLLNYVANDEETIRHELLHMLLPSYNNSSIDEGMVQLFLNELYGYDIDEHFFDASLCKIFCRILN